MRKAILIVIVIIAIVSLSTCFFDSEEEGGNSPYHFSTYLSVTTSRSHHAHIEDRLFFDFTNNIAISVKYYSSGDNRYRLNHVYKITVDPNGKTTLIDEEGTIVGYFPKISDDVTVYSLFYDASNNLKYKYLSQIIERNPISALTYAGFYEKYPDPTYIK